MDSPLILTVISLGGVVGSYRSPKTHSLQSTPSIAKCHIPIFVNAQMLCILKCKLGSCQSNHGGH